MLLFLLLSLPLLAQQHGVIVRLATAREPELTPGKIVTASFAVSSQLSRDEQFVEDITLPEGWQKIAPIDQPFQLHPNEQQVRVVVISVPLNAASGEHEIRYGIKSRKDYAVTDSAPLTVHILPVTKVEVLFVDKPSLVVAGDTYETHVKVINRGNSRESIKLHVQSAPTYPFQIEHPAIELGAGDSQTVRVTVDTDATLNKRITQSLKVTAETSSMKEPVSRTLLVEIVPKITGDSDPWFRLPAQMRFTGVGQSGRGAGFQMEFSGAGNLNEQGTQKIDFLLRGPDTLSKSDAFGLRDEYRVSYFDQLMDVHVGDRNYTLSPLTERYGYGRGAEVDLHRTNTAAGAFYFESRWRKETFNEIGSFVQQDFTHLFTMRANFLAKEGHSGFLTNALPANIYSFQPQLHLGKALDIDFEYGFSDSDQPGHDQNRAYRAQFKGQLSGVDYSLERIYAQPRYFGYYNNSASTYGTVAFPIYKRLRGNFSYNDYESNLAHDPSRSPVANHETLIQPGLLYNLSSRTDLTLQYRHILRQDMLKPTEFNLEENSARLGIGHSFGRLSVQGFLEGGVAEDKLTGKDHNVERTGLYLTYSPSASQSYSAFGTFGSSYFISGAQRSTTLGVSAKWLLFHRLTVDASFAKNRYDSTVAHEQNTAYVTASYTFRNGHSVALGGRWIGDDVTHRNETSAFISYTIPLSLPIRKKQNVGSIRGKIFESDDSLLQPVPRAVLRWDGAAAVSGANGEFELPGLKPGSYKLRLDQKSIGMNRVATEPMPLQVEVTNGRPTQIKLKLVAACTLNVSVELFKAGLTASGANTQQQAGGIEAAVVEITNGPET
ncbi:MAG: hypothetical protein JWO95_283, partial [Verrucomicrobiales bacterium]|nr:hypothetical protein [Verrucomicrobiales bacterium]